MKTVLVLGGFGFIGSNLLNYIDEFESDGYNVIVFDKQKVHPYGISFKCVSQVYTGDFGNKQDLMQIFQENNIEQVFHFLNTTVPATSEDIRFDVESNLLGTIGLLEIMELNGVKDIVFISSGGAIYNATKDKVHIEEEDAFPLSSYGIVKLAIEKYIHMFGERNNFRYLILRLSNPYGPFHYSLKQGIINVALRKAMNAEPLTIWGDGSSRKDYIFIKDFIKILITLLKKGISNEIINIGSGSNFSLNDIINEIRAVEPSLKWSYVEQKKFDNITFMLSIDKLKGYIGDFEFTTLQAGVKETNSWLKNIKTE